jgi:hypothetical protein
MANDLRKNRLFGSGNEMFKTGRTMMNGMTQSIKKIRLRS